MLNPETPPAPRDRATSWRPDQGCKARIKTTATRAAHAYAVGSRQDSASCRNPHQSNGQCKRVPSWREQDERRFVMSPWQTVTAMIMAPRSRWGWSPQTCSHRRADGCGAQAGVALPRQPTSPARLGPANADQKRPLPARRSRAPAGLPSAPPAQRMWPRSDLRSRAPPTGPRAPSGQRMGSLVFADR